MKKKIYFIIYSIVQCIIGIYSFINLDKLADSTLKEMESILGPEMASSEMFAEMFSLESLKASCALSSGVLIVLSIIFLILACRNSVFKKKGLAIGLIIGSFLCSIVSLSTYLIIATLVVVLAGKSEKTLNEKSKEGKKIKKLRELKVTGKDLLAAGILTAIYLFFQFTPAPAKLSETVAFIIFTVFQVGMFIGVFAVFQKRFKRDFAALKENKDTYNYSSHWNKSGSHYIVDKIRLNGTYFSTKYSSIHEYPDGLFIDVLVYDQTSNNKFIGKLHSYTVHMLSKIIEVRWYNRPRRNPNFRKEMVLLPFIRILPLNAWHKIYEFVLTLYKHKKNAKYVIDSTGKLQKKGPFSIEGLEDVQRVDFDGGFKAPIPEDYTNYLTFDYGPGYLPEPPLTKRAAPHNFARIDLGEYIFETRTTPEYREVNVHGELFEKEI